MPKISESPVLTIEKPSYIVCLLLIEQVLNFVVYIKETKTSKLTANFLGQQLLAYLFPTSQKLLDFLQRNPEVVKVRTTLKDRPQISLHLDVQIGKDYSIQKCFPFKALTEPITGELELRIAKAIEFHQQSLKQEFQVEHLQFIEQIEEQAKPSRRTANTLNHSIRIEEDAQHQGESMLANLGDSRSDNGEPYNLQENEGWDRSLSMSSPDLHSIGSKLMKRNIWVALQDAKKEHYFSYDKILQSLTNEHVHLASSCPIQVEAPNRWQETKVLLIAAIDISLGIVAGSISKMKGCCGNPLSASIHATQNSIEVKFEGQVILIPNSKAQANDYLGMRVRKRKERKTDLEFYLNNILLYQRQTNINEVVVYPFVQTFRAGCQFDVDL